MLDMAGSEWRWEERGAVSAEDGRAHFARVRQTLAGGCFRVFAVGDAVILMGRGGVLSTAPGDVYLAQILDFYEAFPVAGRAATADGMKVVFRWFYWNAAEVPAAALRRRDPVSVGGGGAASPLMEEDFFMSNFVERAQPNSVSTIIGRALLCPSLRELPEYKARLARGRADARAVLSAGAPARLPLTDADQVYLCRWYYARADDGPAFPPPGRLMALPHGALSYFLRYPTSEHNGVYPKLLDFRRRARAQVRAARRGDAAARGAAVSTAMERKKTAGGGGKAALTAAAATAADLAPALATKPPSDAAEPASVVQALADVKTMQLQKTPVEEAVLGTTAKAGSASGSKAATAASEADRPRARGAAAELRVAGGGIAKRGAQAPKPAAALRQVNALESKARAGAEWPSVDQAPPAASEAAGLLGGLRGTRLDGVLPRMWAAVLRQVQMVAGERGGLDGRAQAVREGSTAEPRDGED